MPVVATYMLARQPTLVGRKSEHEELQRTLDAGRPELVAIYERRRSGKTFLIRTFFRLRTQLELIGAHVAVDALEEEIEWGAMECWESSSRFGSPMRA